MSWMEKLYHTYERCAGNEPDGVDKLMPICHTMQQAQIEIVISDSGSFRSASVLEKNDCTTMIPCTEESGGRAGSKPVNHPLCDKLQYISGDFLGFGGDVTSGFSSDPQEPHQAFLGSIRAWAMSPFHHPKVTAILRYVDEGHVVADLVREGILPVGADGKLLKQWVGQKENAPAIFRAMQSGQSPEEAFLRWRVEGKDASSATWDDTELVSAWISYYQEKQTKKGSCMVTGDDTTLAIQHPAKLRHGGDKAKLVSSNDTSGYTFRGKFVEADQATAIGFEVTQKAHNALRWLIKNQAYRNGDQAIVSWAVSGEPIPSFFSSTFQLAPPESADTAQGFAKRLSAAIAGYGSKLDPGTDIVVMGIDSATPGRMGITFYRELKGSEFLERLETWHRRYAWMQDFGKDSKFIGAPAPRDIAEAAYGRRLDDKLRKSTVERLLPCIIDGVLVPNDLVESVVRRAINRAGIERWEWEKCLGIACGLFKGRHIEKDYRMALDQSRTSRDYLYGRLLAIADNIESFALSAAGEKRETTAARLMQRFADRPASTWRNISMGLRPYIARLRAGERSVAFLVARERLLDQVTDSFDPKDFINDARLTGEFLLGYHSQRQAWRPAESPADQKPVEIATEESRN